MDFVEGETGAACSGEPNATPTVDVGFVGGGVRGAFGVIATVDARGDAVGLVTSGVDVVERIVLRVKEGLVLPPMAPVVLRRVKPD